MYKKSLSKLFYRRLQSLDNQQENILESTIDKEDGQGKKRRRRGRKSRIIAQVIVCLLLVVLFSFSALGGAAAAYYTAATNTIQTDTETALRDADVVETDLVYDQDVVNILLIGQDRRPGEGRARSDAMIIATINKTDKTIKLTSLMRDLYVQIPGYSDNRINAANTVNNIFEAGKVNFNVAVNVNIKIFLNGCI